MQAPNLSAIVAAIRSESTSDRRRAGSYENVVNMSPGHDSPSLRFGAGCRPLAAVEPPRGWVSTAAAAPSAHCPTLLKEVGELPARRNDPAAGTRESLPAPQLGKFWNK